GATSATTGCSRSRRCRRSRCTWCRARRRPVEWARRGCRTSRRRCATPSSPARGNAFAGYRSGGWGSCPGSPGLPPRTRAAASPPAVYLELLQDVVDVVLDGGHLDPQPLRDLLVREPLVDEPHDLALAAREMRLDSIGAAIGR